MKNISGIGIGISSLLVTFVLLCLITFATLSLSTSQASFNLSKTTSDNVVQYYVADSNANRQLAKIDAILIDFANATNSEETYIQSVIQFFANSDLADVNIYNDKTTLSYTVFISESKELQIELNIALNNEISRYSVIKWQKVNTLEWVSDDTIPVYEFNN